MIPKLLSRLLGKPAPPAASPSDSPSDVDSAVPAKLRGSRSRGGRGTRSAAAAPDSASSNGAGAQPLAADAKPDEARRRHRGGRGRQELLAGAPSKREGGEGTRQPTASRGLAPSKREGGEGTRQPTASRGLAPSKREGGEPPAPAKRPAKREESRSARRSAGGGSGGRRSRFSDDVKLGPVPRDEAFGSLRVSAPVARAIAEMGYTRPTPIQELVIEPLLRGADLVGQAQTGTGKTAGFGIPIAEAVDARERHVQAIVLTPTRELARQVAEELGKLCKHRGAEVAAVYGGARLGPQIKSLERGAPIVVGTPGRVIDLLDRDALRLDRVRMAMLDEADQMLDIGFLPDIRRILRATPLSRQTALFTATVPTAIRRLIYSYLREPEWFRVGEESEPVEQVEQRYIEVAHRDKLAALLETLNRDEQTLVFRRTQGDVDWLVRSLSRRDIPVAAIHGGLPQGERNAVMQRFRDGKLKLLISTNLTSRGIDVPTVANVINYDIPESIEEYVHRIGRTARMGRAGVAITFVSEWDLEFFDAIKAHVGAGLAPMEISLYKSAAVVSP